MTSSQNKKKEIFEYYNSEEFEPELPDNLNRRHFRFKTSDNCWRKVKEKIRNKDELIKNIFKLGGCDIYYSVSKWLQPRKISAKNVSGTYHVADNLLLGSDLVFDIDAEEPITMEGLNKAKKSANNIYELMKDHPEYEFKYFAFSGNKGFRLSYNDTTEIPKDPRHRIEFVEKKRKIFIKQLLKEYEEKKSSNKLYKLKPFFDEKVTTNVMCVIRMLGSVHSTTGYISTKLPVNLMKKSVKKVLDHVPYIGKKRPGIPEREMTEKDDEDEISSPRPRLLISEDDATGLASLPKTKYKYFITNRVLGIKKGFIPIFIYQKNQKKYKKEILRLQEKYKLGDLYVFKHEEKTVVISLKTCQKRRLQKILNVSTSKTKFDFLRHKRIFAPFLMNFQEKIKQKHPISWVSKGHFHYVEPMVPYKHKRFCGWSKIELIRASKVKTNG